MLWSISHAVSSYVWGATVWWMVLHFIYLHVQSPFLFAISHRSPSQVGPRGFSTMIIQELWAWPQHCSQAFDVYSLAFIPSDFSDRFNAKLQTNLLFCYCSSIPWKQKIKLVLGGHALMSCSSRWRQKQFKWDTLASLDIMNMEISLIVHIYLSLTRCVSNAQHWWGLIVFHLPEYHVHLISTQKIPHLPERFTDSLIVQLVKPCVSVTFKRVVKNTTGRHECNTT